VSGLCFAILAHAHPEALADQVANLRLVHPQSRVVVFNGGSDVELTAGLDVEVCPTSRPLRHGHLALFHALTMEWVAGSAFDHLVTLDSDVLAVRGGLEGLLTGVDYAAPHLSEVRPGTPWRPGRRFLRAWPEWQPLLGGEHPWRCFNPVQVFGRTYVESWVASPVRADLLERLAATRLEAVEEVVWPSLTERLGLSRVALPGDDALRLSRHSPAELGLHLQSPAVHFVHKVGMAVDDTDRRLIREHVQGRSPDFGVAADYPVSSGESALRRAAGWGKDLAHVVQRRR
jgi:hypothetical protein